MTYKSHGFFVNLHINVSVKTMRKLLFSVVTIICSLTGYSQSYDERIANAMNSGDWFALDSIYNAAPKDSIMPFLEVYSRGLIGNRLNSMGHKTKRATECNTVKG